MNYSKMERPIDIDYALPVCIPNATPRPSSVRNATIGRIESGGAALFLSVAAMIIKTRIAAPRNSEKKHDTFVM
jgi:hypothetical protein